MSKKLELKNSEFSILHQLEDTQFLVDTNWDDEEQMFKLTMKWWCEDINGTSSLTLSWGTDKEKDFIRTFNNFKKIETAKEWKYKFEHQFDEKKSTKKVLPTKK